MFYLFPGLAVVMAMLSLYAFSLRRLRKRGWARALADVRPTDEAPGFPGAPEKVWLFTGPPTNAAQGRHITWAHYPVYLARWLGVAMLLRFPPFLWRTIRCSIRRRRICYVPAIPDADVFDIFIGGPLMVMAELRGNLMAFEIPDMPLKTMKGINPSSLRLVFDARDKSIVEASWQGRDIRGDNGRITTLMLLTLIMWAHPQTHIAAERSAREIADKRIRALEPSNRYVVALHQGLLYGPLSPLATGQPLSINVDKETGVRTAATVRLPHNLDPEKMRFRYYRFLLEARKVLFRELRRAGLDVNAEWLFNNIVVHSVDHYLLYRNLYKISAWSLDGGTGLRSYWRSQVFLAVWVRHVTSPFEREKIRGFSREKHGFYRSLHAGLVEIDRELADCILASTSF